MPLTQLGRYKITGIVGRGAMGVVYQAHDPLIERTVAIKTVECTGLSREEAEDFELRFDREVKAAGRLNHPNIITIYDVGRSDDLSYVAMELLVGRTLREILDSCDLLPIDRIASIAAQIADGLAYAHANGVVHRDIKPANIMILDNDAVRIADFGVALLSSGSHTVAGKAFGSPKYMSPEQVTGDKVDGRSDIFALGAVLYEMLAGRPPFAGADLNAVLYQVLNSAPPLPSTFNPGLLHGFDRIVAHALAKNPDKRYQNAREMASDLRKYRRLARQEQKKLAAEGAPTEMLRQSFAAGAGDVTESVDALKVAAKSSSHERRRGHRSRYAVTPPAPTVGRSRALLYGVPVFLLALFAFVWQRSAQAPLPPVALLPEAIVAEAAPAAPNEPVAEVSLPKASLNENTEPEPKTSPEADQTVPVGEQGSLSSVPQPVTSDSTPAVVSDGRIRLAIAPWGEVFVDGKKAGVSPPLTELRLPAGKYRIEVRNGDFKPYRKRVELAAEGSVRIKHKFE